MVSSGNLGMRNPEDLKKTPINPDPHPDQLKVYEPVEKQRRIMGHDLENNVPFFAVGLLYVITSGEDGDATPLYLYTATKVIHHLAYWSAQPHDLRAAVWTITNASFLWMSSMVWKKL
eukprot:CAMPEP_0113611876 /NCGR_PEP_ID=MMETSP0017_2-20120614/5799_1 /TAXON_ID=2856 /ORGANISM="Cylindrotheca closterium" /LENGTH=117 /DNA_ID=CAMNT_0000520871 /DNA_START=707 /DNA_END=1063 /DNA_ORIENTATION=+ /assembly_acc=CAM_ASM_000147